ncbi:acyltransferase-domain-containing protein [Pleomassaria siparia CBS 279.74]|uniref:Acyltransferase-domain-containing protein n=1 Tax=Pleomassaria siparia CBS 279.74 TaxID=1314801 RepID=A0A6G1KRE0_9PLEO|nr:acyltransferase-domain-containing protein [Pleomassaria siparia CBS 279.74]
MPTTTIADGLLQRHPPTSIPIHSTKEHDKKDTHVQHPGGAIKHSPWQQTIRMALLALYFHACCFLSLIPTFSIAISQFMGAPLYFYSKDFFYAWMAMTKQQFGVVATTMTYWWAPVKMRISGDESVRGQMRKTPDGRLECDFPERMVLISNHQIYTDWIYLWWVAYTSRMHGHIYIILKESIKYIPILGSGMMFYGFIFLSRKWSKDKERFHHRLRKLSASHSGPMSGTSFFDPMWLLIFPEGTNLSSNGRTSSKKWADKIGIEDMRHCLLPRSTGLLFCLQELKQTVDWVYDCTVAYEGVPKLTRDRRGKYGQDFFTLRSSYCQGRPPKSISMHWRRFATKDIPVHDEKEFTDWLLARWREKDDLLEHYVATGDFPADTGATPGINDAKLLRGAGIIETDVRPSKPLEFLQIILPPAALALMINVVWKFFNMVLKVLNIK